MRINDAEMDRISEQTVHSDHVDCRFICGPAGTGKTYQMRQRIVADPSFGVLCATTGIAALNLGTVTLNSLLKYFDTQSMRDSFLSGHLARMIHEAMHKQGKRSIIVDEGSMLPAEQLEYLYYGVQAANAFTDAEGCPVGILIVGDFAQLPPVKARWAFESEIWEHFALNTERLTKNWRQDDGRFLEALGHVRRGDGGPAAEILSSLGITWHTSRDMEYDGTTIVAKNNLVSNHNRVCLLHLAGKSFSVSSRRWGKQRVEWGENRNTHEWGIPPHSDYKIGALVMILSNDVENWSYANGDTGHIESFEFDCFNIKLIRTGETVCIPQLIRDCDQPDQPEGWEGERYEDLDWRPNEPHVRKKRYVLGQIEFYPLRLAYASTVHKSQGLTLDRCQIDFRDQFFGQSAMAYVAMSRCRSVAGLRMVGQKDVFIKQVKADMKAREWL